MNWASAVAAPSSLLALAPTVHVGVAAVPISLAVFFGDSIPTH